ncbi:MAG TPA: hypothetical protein VFI02_19775 [Armatimonadota bacterium]|nr:hypothetical protein [Armatimonadota bacterium]
MANRGMNYVMDPISAFGEEREFATLPVAFSLTEGILDLDIRGMNDKAILLKNTGSVNPMDYQILASIDAVTSPADATYDITHKASTSVAKSDQAFEEFANYYNFIRIQIKSALGASAELKVAATGN